MKNRFKMIFALLLIISAVAYVDLLASKSGFILIVAPKIRGDGIPIKGLEDINESKLTLTYENIYDKSIKILGTNHSIILKGTNSSYPYVMDYGITSGSFFTKKAMDNKHKYAVLNEKAAFDIFGTLDAVGNEIKIDMTPYIVTGVINDKDTDNMNVFVPASCLSESAESVMISLPQSGGLTEEYIKNELKRIGISELKYDFINLALVSKSLQNNVIVSLELVMLAFVLPAIKKSLISAGGYWNKLRQKLKEYYFAELLKNETRTVQRLIVLIITTALLIVAVLAVLPDLFEKYLEWNRVRQGAAVFYARNLILC